MSIPIYSIPMNFHGFYFPLINEQYPSINGIRGSTNRWLPRWPAWPPMAAWQGAGGACWDAVQRVCALGLWAKGWAKRCLKATTHHEPWRKTIEKQEKKKDSNYFFIMCFLTYKYVHIYEYIIVSISILMYLSIHVIYRYRERDRYRMPTVSPMCHESGTEPWQSKDMQM